MALPSDVKIFTEILGPYDIMDFSVDVAGLLEASETLASYTVTVPTESSLLGLTLGSGTGYTTSINGTVITFWLSIDAAHQADAIFNSPVTMPITVSITTNSVPPRKKTRTVGIKVGIRG